MLVRKLAATAAICMLLSTSCLAGSKDGDAAKGEGAWGNTVSVANVEVTNDGYVTGYICNVSLASIHKVEVGVGAYDSKGNPIYYGASTFGMTLPPNGYWRFRVKAGDAFVLSSVHLSVIGVSVDGNDLTMTGSSAVLVPRNSSH